MSARKKVVLFTPEEQAEAEAAHARACHDHAARAGRDDAAKMSVPHHLRFHAIEWQSVYEAAFRAAKEPA